MSSSTFDPGNIHTSDGHLDGSITGVHLVQNERTNERLIVGGSDDGSIGIWSLRYPENFEVFQVH